MIAQCPVSLPNKDFVNIKKNAWKVEGKLFQLCIISHEN